MNHFDKVKAQSRYGTWAGKPFSSTSRFHHRVEAPELGGEFEVRGVKHPDPEPALDFAEWEILGRPPRRAVVYARAFEYATLAETHDEFLQSLQSITRGGVNYTPLTGGPGDVCVESTMARDNLLIDATVDEVGDIPHRLPVLRAIDAWLMSDWPLAASRRKRASASLDVVLRVKPERLRVGEPGDVALEVRLGERLLDPERLPHRIVVAPGRIERRGVGYVFTPSAAGSATVSASVLGPGGEHGAATLSLQVQ